MLLTLAASVPSWVIFVLAALLLMVCLFMSLVILIQRPRGGGLAGAFGGSGGAVQQAFGSKVGDVLTWFTVGCFVAFLGLSIALTWAIPTAAKRAEATVSADNSTSNSAPATSQPAAPASQPAQ